MSVRRLSLVVLACLLAVTAAAPARGQVRRSQKQLERDALRESLRTGVYPLESTATAAPPLTTGAVAMRTVRILTRASVDARFWNIYGSYIKDFERQVILRTRLKNMDTRARQLNLEVLYIGETPEGRDRYIFARTNEVILLDPGEWTERVNISPVLTARVVQYIAPGGRSCYSPYESPYSSGPERSYGVKYSTGHKIEGYIVRVLEDDAVLSVNVSSKYLESDARNPAVIAEWLAKGGLLPQPP